MWRFCVSFKKSHLLATTSGRCHELRNAFSNCSVAARAARHRILAQSNSGPSSERIHQGLRHHSTRFFGTADFSSSRLSVSTTLITVTFSRCVFFLFWHFTDLFCAQANCTSKKQSYLELTSFLGFVLLSTSIRTGSSCSDFRPRSPCARFRLFWR